LLVGRRYLSETSMTLVLAAATDHDRDREEVLELIASWLAASPPTITSYTTRCDLTLAGGRAIRSTAAPLRCPVRRNGATGH
jgi:hypothetical protein